MLGIRIRILLRQSPGDADDSLLLFGDGSLVNVGDIRDLKGGFKGVDLLTLSACNTAASGPGADGKEVECFATIAQERGAKAVLASLWPVSDRGTSELMKSFYPLRIQSEPAGSARVSIWRGSDPVCGSVKAQHPRISPRAICVDFLPLDSTDLVADVQRLPLRDGSVDLVIATGLFEHVVDERALMEEIHRVLRPGGVAHIEMPFLQQYHDDPIDCRRMTVSGLELAMGRSGFQKQRSGVHIGPSVTIATLLSYYAALLCEGRHLAFKVLSTLVFAVVSTLLWPLKFLDRFLAGKPSAHRLAFGVYFTGRKL